MGNLVRLLREMVRAPVVLNGCKVSLVVGTCLNLVNQGDALVHLAGVDWVRFGLNFAVPYLVSTYSAAKMRQGDAS